MSSQDYYQHQGPPQGYTQQQGGYPPQGYTGPHPPPQAYGPPQGQYQQQYGPPQGQYPPQGYPAQQGMEYQQPQQQQQRRQGGDQGCLMGCIAALCCCCAVEEGCECWYVTLFSINPANLLMRQSQYRSLRVLLLNQQDHIS
ncbi:hypothetical protein HDV64DRAFT_256658 [Trichoderma sp. TUCIM 5745]